MTAVRGNPDLMSFLEYNDYDEIKVGSLHHRVSKKQNRAFSLKTEIRLGARPQQRFFLRDAIQPTRPGLCFRCFTTPDIPPWPRRFHPTARPTGEGGATTHAVLVASSARTLLKVSTNFRNQILLSDNFLKMPGARQSLSSRKSYILNLLATANRAPDV